MHSPARSIRYTWDLSVGLLLALGGPLLGWFVLAGIPLAFLILISSVWLAAIGICWRQPLLRLAGPLFLYEIIRETRRWRYFLLRIYCYLILFVLVLAALIWSANGTSLVLTVSEGARVAQTIAVLLLCAHLFLVTLVAPVYVGGAVSEEKERKTLEFLMATELGSNEILLGKLGVRLANMGLMLLTGLPVLALLQLVGGLDADLVLGGFVATLAYTFSLSCMALYNSVRARRTRDAILRTYFKLVAYLIGSWAGLSFLRVLAGMWYPVPSGFFPGRAAPSQPSWVTDLFEYLDFLGVGNPFLIDRTMVTQMAAGRTPAQAFVTVFLEFIGFHTIVGLLLLAAAMFSFRKVFQQEQEIVTPVPKERTARRSRDIGNHPLLWKELWIEGASKPGCLRILLTWMIVLGSFIPVWQISRSDPDAFVVQARTRILTRELTNREKQLREKLEKDYSNCAFNLSNIILCLFLLRIAVHASSTLSRERERQTLDSLLCCPVTPAQVMNAKWGGAMLSIRAGWLWLAGVWLIGATKGNIPLAALALLLVVWLMYAGSIACLGQWYSMISSSSTRALIYTMATVAVLFTGTIALPMQSATWYVSPETRNGFREWLFRFEISMSPAFVFGRLIPVSLSPDTYGGPHGEAWEGPMVMVGAAVWLGGGALLWRRTNRLLRGQMCPQRGKLVPDRIRKASNSE